MQSSEIAFDKTWAKQSMIQYQTIGNILDDKTELFPDISLFTDPHLVLSVALDYIFGRGVLEGDLKWLGAICLILSIVVENCQPKDIIDNMMSGEDDTEFAENWRGEITPRDVERVHKSIGDQI